MMKSNPVRFAILGFGHHATRRLLPAFAQSEGAALVGLWRRDEAARRKDCAELAIEHCFASREELCGSPEVDAIFITSPDAMHLADTELALKHGKAVLCEKPVAMNAAEAEKMAKAAAAAGLLYGVGQNFRFNRSVEWMREQIAGGTIGTPQLIHAQFAYPAQRSARRWIADATLACGGPIADVGVHCIDAIRFLLSDEVQSVSTLARTAGSGAEVDVVASLQMEMRSGAFANVTVSALAPYRTLLEVVGSEGVVVAENGFLVDRPVEVVVRRGGDVIETRTFDNSDGYSRMLDSFAGAYRGEGEFKASGADAVKNMHALDAAYRSWKTGTRETLET